MRWRLLAGPMALTALFGSVVAHAEETSSRTLDRVVVEWHAPELGGAKRPKIIFERELALEARWEALADPRGPENGFEDRHLRAALARHVAEALLSELPISPRPSPQEVARRAEVAFKMLVERSRGADAIQRAARLEGISKDEVDALMRRRARASFYLDRMVAPMLEATEVELRKLHASGQTPVSRDAPFEENRAAIAKFATAERLRKAVEGFYQNARSRLTIRIVSPQVRRSSRL